MAVAALEPALSAREEPTPDENLHEKMEAILDLTRGDASRAGGSGCVRRYDATSSGLGVRGFLGAVAC
jgi:hypothetical protein